jgi:hypothetical protein
MKSIAVALCLLFTINITACKQPSSAKNTLNSTAVNAAATSASEAFAPHKASLAEQKMCDEQAQKRFREDDSEVATHPSKYHLLSTYRSHYDSSVNVCYVRIDFAYFDKAPATSIYVSDAFEGREFASFYWPDTNKKVYFGGCKIMLRGNAPIFCNSLHDFNALLGKYFGFAE